MAWPNRANVSLSSNDSALQSGNVKYNGDLEKVLLVLDWVGMKAGSMRRESEVEADVPMTSPN